MATTPGTSDAVLLDAILSPLLARARWSLLRPPNGTADEVTKYLVCDERGRVTFVAHVSAPAYPDLAARGAARADEAATAPGPTLGARVLCACAAGVIERRSWAVYPIMRTLSRWKPLRVCQRALLRRHLLAWLRGTTAATARPFAPDAIEAGVIGPLTWIAEGGDLPDHARRAAAAALARLASGRWGPRQVLMHGDLWKGNALLEPTALPDLARFAVIDWAGSTSCGFGFSDLVRAAVSFDAGEKPLAEEGTTHCRLLECDREDAVSHLMAAFGSIGLRRECFAPERFRAQLTTCQGALASAAEDTTRPARGVHLLFLRPWPPPAPRCCSTRHAPKWRRDSMMFAPSLGRTPRSSA